MGKIKIALDFDGVFNSNLMFFRKLIDVLDADFIVLSITNKKVIDKIYGMGLNKVLPVYTLPFKKYSDMPKQKLQLCEMTQPDILIDDIKEVVDYINQKATKTKAVLWQINQIG